MKRIAQIGKSYLLLEEKVETIKILYQQYKPTVNNLRLLVPVSGELVEAERAEVLRENTFVVFLAYPIIIAKRFRNEEDVLEKGLDGYAEYKMKVKFKIILFVW